MMSHNESNSSDEDTTKDQLNVDKQQTRSIDSDDDSQSSKHSVASPANSEDSRNSQYDLDSNTMDTKNINEKTLKRFRKKYRWEKLYINRDLIQHSNNDDNATTKFYLKVVNFPQDWPMSKLKEFILKEYGQIDKFYVGCDEDLCFMGAIKLEFDHFNDYRKAWDKLNEKIIDGVTLYADTIESDEEVSDDGSSPKKKRKTQAVWRPDIDVWESDPKGLYGFRPEFLSSLGITPPIDKWVQVTNFRCDKSELKEVLELAGQVLICTLDVKGQKVAKVMYSHPLEAVQAVSMLNNQQFYGQALKVTLERYPVGTVFLPKGLQAVGSGLGMAGKPLRDIVKQYERFVNYKSSFVNSTVFRNPDLLFSNSDETELYVPKSLEELGTSLKIKYQNNSWSTDSGATHQTLQNFNSNLSTNFAPTGSIGPTVSSFGPSGPVPGYSGQNYPGPNSGPIAGQNMSGPGPMFQPTGPNGPLHGPNGPIPARPIGPGPMQGLSGLAAHAGHISRPIAPMSSPISGPMTGSFATGQMAGPRDSSSYRSMYGAAGSMSGFNGPHNTNVNAISGASQDQMPINAQTRFSNAVELSNLPLSTTFSLLSEKMAQCGQVMSLQLTSPGCAVVQFAQQSHAQKCCQQYNNLHVMGNLIQVKFIYD